MTNLQKEQKKQIEESIRIQQERDSFLFKQDCRRTALQLAERSSKNAVGGKADAAGILQDAELFYAWLTQEL